MLAGPVFRDIRDGPAKFREVRVEAYTLVWPNGADLCPDTVIWGGLPHAGTCTASEPDRLYYRQG